MCQSANCSQMICDGYLVLWCCALLFISSSETMRNSIIDKQNDNSRMVRYKFHPNSVENHDNEAEFISSDLRKNSIKDNVQYISMHTNFRDNNREDDDSLKYEFPAHFIKYLEEDNQTLLEIRANLIKTDSKDNSNNDKKNYIVSSEMCDNICIKLCCPLGDRMDNKKDCIDGTDEFIFPEVYNRSDDLESKTKRMNELFQMIIQDPCQETERFMFNPDYPEEKYIFLANGSLYLPYFNIFVESTSYCLAVVDHNQFEAIICSETVNKIIQEGKDNILNYNKNWSNQVIIYLSCHIVSMLCLLTVFLVYLILPELRNIHSFMLRRYSSLLFIGYMFDIIDYPMSNAMHQIYSVCIINALIRYFCSLANCFWLSVMSFDMWWTFRELRSLQRNVKQQERKKLIYSIFAWGGPLIFTIICAIMDFVPSVPKKMIRPRFGVHICWFHEQAAFQLYLYGPVSICIISSVCLSIYTALKIRNYEKDAIRYLKDLESRCYNDSKKWFNLYLKLFIVIFIVMGISWFAGTILRLYAHMSGMYIFWSTMCLINMVKNLSIFITFVCKKSILQLLLKRFGCQKHDVLSETRHAANITDLNSCRTPPEISLWKKISFCVHKNHRVKSLPDETSF